MVSSSISSSSWQLVIGMYSEKLGLLLSLLSKGGTKLGDVHPQMKFNHRIFIGQLGSRRVADVEALDQECAR